MTPSENMPQEEAVVSVRDLRMRYGDNDVLRGVDLDVWRGEVVSLLGPNGAGKTTAIEILEGFRVRSAGEVSVLGVDPEHVDDAWRARVGVVMQSWRDHARWSPRDLLRHVGALYAPYSTDERPRPRDADELLDIVGLSAQADQHIRLLSGGQRRRLDLAIGIVGTPEVLFLDEPTVGLDPEARRDFHDLVHTLSDVHDTTILLTTHDLDEADKLSDRILILAGGHIVADGSADDLSRELQREAQVRWTALGSRHVHSTFEPTQFVRDLLAGPDGDDVTDLLVSRPTLEETYLTLVRTHEQDAPELEVVT